MFVDEGTILGERASRRLTFIEEIFLKISGNLRRHFVRIACPEERLHRLLPVRKTVSINL
jgi:hypothetical protein